MQRQVGRQAVVVGAGISGLAAAGVIAGHFENVVILERDALPSGPTARSGAPQGRHPHGLLSGGVRALEALFPGFTHDLVRAGAVPIGAMSEFVLEAPGCDAMPQRELGFTLYGASRPLIELVLRRRVEALGNVAFRPACRVSAIATTPDRHRVIGIRYEANGDVSRTMPAELVVDASGRGMLTLAMLDAIGAPRPETSVIGIDIAYASAFVPIPRDAPEWKLAITLPDPAGNDSAGLVGATENDRWMVLLATRGVVPPIESWDDFLAAARRLRTPTIANALAHVAPPQEIRHYLFEDNVWRHFERMPALPHGILPIGDAICRFNPVHGQGMSVAAQEARLLGDLLRDAPAANPVASVQRGYLAEVGSIIATPWQLSAVADLAFANARGDRPPEFDAMMQKQAALIAAASRDPVVQRALVEVIQLLKPGSTLQSPEIRRRIGAIAKVAA